MVSSKGWRIIGAANYRLPSDSRSRRPKIDSAATQRIITVFTVSGDILPQGQISNKPRHDNNFRTNDQMTIADKMTTYTQKIRAHPCSISLPIIPRIALQLC